MKSRRLCLRWILTRMLSITERVCRNLSRMMRRTLRLCRKAAMQMIRHLCLCRDMTTVMRRTLCVCSNIAANMRRHSGALVQTHAHADEQNNALVQHPDHGDCNRTMCMCRTKTLVLQRMRVWAEAWGWAMRRWSQQSHLREPHIALFIPPCWSCALCMCSRTILPDSPATALAVAPFYMLPANDNGGASCQVDAPSKPLRR